VDSTVIDSAQETYLGIQEVNRYSQEEDEHEEGEQLVTEVRCWAHSDDANLGLTTMYAVR
jgi:hypothetical protein